MDIHIHSHGEISDRKKCREENPEALASPEQVSKKKKKRRKKQNGEEHVEPPPQVCPNPLVLDTGIPIVPETENGAIPNTHANADLGPKHKTLIPETEKGEGPIVATVEHPVPDPIPQKKMKRKKKSKSVLVPQGAELDVELPQLCSTVDSEVKSKMKDGEGSNVAIADSHVLQPTASIDTPQEKKSEGKNQNVHSEPELKESNTAENPQLCSHIDPELKEKMKDGAGPKEDAAEAPVVEAMRPEDTPHKKKRKKKTKNVLNPQGMKPELMDSSNVEHPQLYTPVNSEMENKMKNVAEVKEAVAEEHSRVFTKPELEPRLDIATPKDLELKKVAEPNEANVEQPQVCPVDPETPIDIGKDKEAEPIEVQAEHPRAPPGDPTTPVDQSRGKRKRKRGKKETICLEEKVENRSNPMCLDVTFNPALNQIQSDPAIPVCPIPAFPMNRTSLGDPAIPIDAEQKTKKKKRKKQRKSALDGEIPNEHIMDQLETPIQTSICHVAAPPVEPTILIDPHPLISTEPEQMSEGKSDKKQESALGRVVVEPNELFGKTPGSHQTTPLNLAIPIDTEQKLKKIKRKKKRKSAQDGVEPNENISKQPEAPSPTSICIEATAPVKAPILMDPGRDTVILVDPAMPASQEQKMSKAKRKRMKKKLKSALNGIGAQPDEHNGTTPEIPLQESACPIATPSLDQTLQIGAATPLQGTTGLSVTDVQVLSILGCLSLMGINFAQPPPETSIQRGNGPLVTSAPSEWPGKSIQGINYAQPPPEASIQRADGPLVTRAPSEWPGNSLQGINYAEPPPEASIQIADGPLVTSALSEWPGKSFQGINYAEPPPEASIQRANGPLVTRAPSEWPGNSFQGCHTCHKRGHNFRQCPRLKCLSNNEEICFFCGEIGHSLGKCSVTRAGGGRFARCLLCHARGHFSNNCPGNGHGICGMVVAANEPINKTA